MLALVHRAGGEPVSLFGTYVEPDGRTTAIERADIQLEALGRWTSPRTGVTYPSGWRITLPRQGLALVCTPVLPDQELDARTSTWIIYWEGEVRCEGSRDGAPVAGDGYVELIGYDRR